MKIVLSNLFRNLFVISLSISLSILLCCGAAYSQTKEPKLTDREHKKAVAFAHMFWAKLIQAKDIRPVLKQYAIKGFYDCLDRRDFAFLRAGQIRQSRASFVNRYYIAESNFMLLLMLSGLTEEDDQFSTLPLEVQNAFTRSAWDAMEYNDSHYDSEKPQPDTEANEYFDQTLMAFERANPLLRKHIERDWAAKRKLIKKATKEFEEYASYAFEPTLWIFDDGRCGLNDKGRRFIAVDIPFFQLMLTKIGGRLRVVQLPFHVD